MFDFQRFIIVNCCIISNRLHVLFSMTPFNCRHTISYGNIYGRLIISFCSKMNNYSEITLSYCIKQILTKLNFEDIFEML